MRMRQWIIILGIIIAIIIVWDEVAYAIWRATNRYEHFSHVREKFAMKGIEDIVNEPDPKLNRPRSGIF